MEKYYRDTLDLCATVMAARMAPIKCYYRTFDMMAVQECK